MVSAGGQARCSCHLFVVISCMLYVCSFKRLLVSFPALLCSWRALLRYARDDVLRLYDGWV